MADDVKKQFGKKRSESNFPKRFTIGLILVMIVMQFFYVATFMGLDNSWTDTLFRWRGIEQADPRITIVAIDDTSLEHVGQYPWPRHVYRRLIKNLYAAGVKVIGLDILFLDPSRPEEDRVLIRATKEAGEKLVHASDIDTRSEKYRLEAKYDFRTPFKALARVTKSMGLVSQVFIDNDGSVRRMPLYIGTSANPFDRTQWPEDPDRQPSFGLKILSVFFGKTAEEVYEMVGANQVLVNIRGIIPGTMEMAPQDDGSLKPVATPPKRAIDHISAWRILEGELNKVEKAKLQGGIVLVGATATGAFDHYPTPFDGMTPGVEMHAYLIDNILNRRWLRHGSEFFTYLMIILFALACYRLVSLPAHWAGLIFALMAVGWIVVSYISFTHLVVLHFWSPMLSLLVIFVVLMVHKTMLEQQQKREVRQMFGQYVSPEVVDILVKDPDKISVGGERRDMTMFFLDIAHFTTISEKMKAENLITFLNHYLSALTDDILKHKGVVDKYIGDCIMAFWNAPIEEPAHRMKACLAAVDCVNTIKRLNEEYVDPTIPEKPAVRIGLNSGDVVVGNTGSARKLAYTVLGDEVNLASRLEGANKFFGSTLMCSESTYEGAKEQVEARVLGRVRVVGKDIPIKVYELLAHKGELSKQWQDAMTPYLEAVAAYEKRKFEEAKKGFDAVLKLIPDDKPTKLYHNACEDYITIPPPPEWEPVFNLTSK